LSGRSRASGARSSVAWDPTRSHTTRKIASPRTSTLRGLPRTGSSGCGAERRACSSRHIAGEAALSSHRRPTASPSRREPSPILSRSRSRSPGTTTCGRSRQSLPGRRLRSGLGGCDSFSDERRRGRRLPARRSHPRRTRTMFRPMSKLRRDASASLQSRCLQSPTGDASSPRTGGRQPRRDH
jgi:hypothetical protein